MKIISALCIPVDGTPYSFECGHDIENFKKYCKENIFTDAEPEVENMVLPTTQKGLKQYVCFLHVAHAVGQWSNHEVNTYLQRMYNGTCPYELCGPVVVFYLGSNANINHEYVSASIETVQEFEEIVEDIKEALTHADKGMWCAEGFSGFL